MKNLLHFNLVFFIGIILLTSATDAVSKSRTQQLIDPTKPKLSNSKNSTVSDNSVKNNSAEFILQSLILKQDRYKAIISGILYKVGEQIGEYKIAKITAKKVYLSRGTEQRILELYSYEIKR
ncbi:hypothetical protein [Pseudoalteromonas denitrificans]|uniref:MSHA biogenesis protein MshK n=1 Tax=Pseudoalteromonas denitrificans DSM 6059 TaxID=1123010 RepID=A0A1I1DWV3_9GAMM|nr:hypothetical protein [Pseudoalteromonas denitrificans]SFB77190.1 MSHA biogenesis protein MshK [Pseudoalteromonas denitrificans DSM 6059]